MMFSATDHHMLQCPSRPFPSLDKSWKSNGGAEIAPSCPRCASPNTKFCYYNNYSLSQPRYFCKGCRRYWTKGGSLRNVPVGGGCRKSRRAKAVRVPQLERGSGNYNYSSDASPGGDSVGGAGEGSPGRTGGGEIDLAVVFAKFLNHDSGFGPEFGGSAMSDQTDIAAGNVSGALSSDVLQEEMAMDLMGELQLLEEGYTQLCDGGEMEIQEKRIQELIGHDDTNANGLPTLLSDEAAAQDILWSDDPQTLQNFTWQPVMQLQEFEPVLSNDHSKISANLIGEFWNSFDLSAHEIFSRP